MQFLRSVPLFSRLQDDDLRVVIGLAVRETVHVGPRCLSPKR